MKQRKFFTLMAMALSFGLMSMASYSEDNDDGRAGHNGSPGEMTCAKSTCHTSFTLNSGPGSVSINAVGMTNWHYVPGQTYTIEVTVAQTNFGLFGFGFEALLGSGANAGTLTPGLDNHALNATVLGNSRKTITHDLDDGLSPNSHTFTFTWLAPATAVPVTFYAAGNAANDNNSDQGDYIYTTSQALTPAVIPNPPTISANGSLNLCNGASVTLSINAQADVTYAWFDANNQQVGTGASFTTTQEGCYDVVATASGGTANSTNTICTDLILVDAGFSGLVTSYCSDSEPVDIVLNSPGGTLAGDGISGTSFNPQIAGPGSHTITYTITTWEGCSDSESFVVNVQEVLSPAFMGLPATICSNAQPVNLVAEINGGTFSGSGMNGNQFTPALPEGVYEITYSTGTGECVQTSTQQIEVLATPDASFTGLQSEYCSNASAVQLIPLNSGGVFSGTGVEGNNFNPQNAGAGASLVSYALVSNNGCSDISEVEVIINQVVSSAFESPVTLCLNSGEIELIPVESGGVFSGVGIAGNVFDPVIGVGTYTVNYTNGEGSCTVSTSQEIEVLALPVATFSGLENGYCIGS
ncbi:MAG: choice-of-anchor V domain-containing protein, partial [Flavobacteriales bacterium]